MNENYLLLVSMANYFGLRFFPSSYMINKETLHRFNTFRDSASKASFICTSEQINKVITFINSTRRALHFATDMGVLAVTKSISEESANDLLFKSFDHMNKLKNGNASGKNLMDISAINSTTACTLASSILTDLFKVTHTMYINHSERINLDAPLLKSFETNMPGCRALIMSDSVAITNPVPFYKIAREREKTEKDNGDIKWKTMVDKLESYPQVQKILVML